MSRTWRTTSTSSTGPYAGHGRSPGTRRSPARWLMAAPLISEPSLPCVFASLRRWRDSRFPQFGAAGMGVTWRGGRQTGRSHLPSRRSSAAHRAASGHLERERLAARACVRHPRGVTSVPAPSQAPVCAELASKARAAGGVVAASRGSQTRPRHNSQSSLWRLLRLWSPRRWLPSASLIPVRRGSRLPQFGAADRGVSSFAIRQTSPWSSWRLRQTCPEQHPAKLGMTAQGTDEHVDHPNERSGSSTDLASSKTSSSRAERPARYTAPILTEHICSLTSVTREP
jgi:hypothetical protein